MDVIVAEAADLSEEDSNGGSLGPLRSPANRSAGS